MQTPRGRIFRFFAFEFAAGMDPEAADEAQRRGLKDFLEAMSSFGDEGILIGEAQSKSRAYAEAILWDSRAFLARAAAWMESRPEVEAGFFRVWRRRAGHLLVE